MWTTDVTPQRVNPGHVTPFQARVDKMHAVLTRKAHSSRAYVGQKSFVAFILARSTLAQKSKRPESSQSPAKWP